MNPSESWPNLCNEELKQNNKNQQLLSQKIMAIFKQITESGTYEIKLWKSIVNILNY